LLVRRHPVTPLLFRVQALYFRETAVAGIQISDSTDIAEKALRSELLLALESARTRLAIAIAMEKKYTLPARWQYYLDTTEQIRCSIRRLRSAKFDGAALKGWACALERLKKISTQDQVCRLCQTLREIVVELDI
jgi:hypothetical protein